MRKFLFPDKIQGKNGTDEKRLLAGSGRRQLNSTWHFKEKNIFKSKATVVGISGNNYNAEQ